MFRWLQHWMKSYQQTRATEHSVGVGWLHKPPQFIGARRGNAWFCPTCLDIRFTDHFADKLMKYGALPEFDLKAVYTNDPWVQNKNCIRCNDSFAHKP
jgi:hypothetical protein